MDQETYLKIIEGYITHYQLPTKIEHVRAEALAWAMGRGNRSGRSAHQYIIDLAGRLDVTLPY